MKRIEAYPGCPTLTWMIANRVCNPRESSDAFISFTGRKGSSKSTSSIAFCEGLANDIANLRGKGEPPEKFFDITHIKSISESGAIDLLSSGALQQENTIWLLDDTGTQWGARNFATAINKSLNAILQICRVYKCVIVANFIAQKHIDVQARGMTDFRAEMQFKNTRTGQAFFKFFYLENNEYGEYKHYLTWHGKRITTWIIEKPSEKLYSQYEKIRMDNTNSYIEDARKKLEEKHKINDTGERIDKRIKNYKEMPQITNNKDRVLKMYNEGKKIGEIVRETGLSRYWIDKCFSVGKGDETNV